MRIKGMRRKGMRIKEVLSRPPQLLDELIKVWEDSVRATHFFLSDAQIKQIREYVPQALEKVEHLIIAEEPPGRTIAFMGVENRRLEMLFLTPAECGKGIGRRLLQYGIENYDIRELTVNEQNPQAVKFYEHMGFTTYKRTNCDEEGNPYPLLYMKLVRCDQEGRTNLGGGVAMKDQERVNWSIVPAAQEDQTEIYRLYQAQLGREFCAWNEFYPGEDEVKGDLSREALFVMKTAEGRIIASISIDEDESVDRLPCWSEDLKPGGELARLAVDPDFQNQGLAKEMIRYGMQVLAQRGYRSVHFLVNKYNEKALRAYAALAFSKVGECQLYEQPFWCYERPI